MNYGRPTYYNCDSCFQQEANEERCPYACCGAQIPILEPLIPVAETRRRSKAPRKSCVAATRVSNGRKKKVSKDQEDCKSFDQSSSSNQASSLNQKPSKTSTSQQPRNGLAHPNDCCCVDCDASEKGLSDNCGSVERKSTRKSIPAKASSSIAFSMAEKSLKNYMYDNPELSETKSKKGCDEDDFTGDDMEVWLLQCPKSFDPKQILNCELGKLGKKAGGPKVECSTDRFSEKKTLAVITPEKAAEYEMFCDSIKLVKPVGKIVVSEKYVSDKENFDSDRRKSKSQSDICQDDAATPALSCDSDENDALQKTEDECNSSDQDVKPIAGKKLKKKLNDQRFTIETTVTVQNVGRKKGKKGNGEQCLPIVPPEPSPEKKKKKSKGAGDDWKC